MSPTTRGIDPSQPPTARRRGQGRRSRRAKRGLPLTPLSTVVKSEVDGALVVDWASSLSRPLSRERPRGAGWRGKWGRSRFNGGVSDDPPHWRGRQTLRDFAPIASRRGLIPVTGWVTSTESSRVTARGTPNGRRPNTPDRT